MANKRCIRYLRFSSEGQSNSSIEWQDAATAQWCDVNKVTIMDTFIDAGFSAKTFDRPDFEKLSIFLAQHYRTVDYLVVNQMDRFSRDAGEALSLVKKLQSKYAVQIVSVSEGITYDHATPGSYFRIGLQLLLAEDDNINRSQKTNSGIYTSKAKEGRYISGITPFGYIKVGERKARHLEIVPEQAAVVKFIYQSFQNGMPIIEIRKQAFQMGYQSKGKMAIQKMLSNPLYSGQLKVKAWKDMPGGLFPAIHAPIIDLITWQQVQWKLKGQPKQKVSISDELPLRGVLHCHCGRMLTGAPSRGRHGNYFYYYKCNTTSKHNNLSAKKAHAQLQEMLGYLSIPANIIAEIKDKSEKDLVSQLKENKQHLGTYKKSLAEVTSDLVSVEEKWIKNQINYDTYQRWHTDTLQKSNTLKAQIDHMATDQTEQFLRLQDNLLYLTDMQAIYNDGATTQKQQLLKMVFDSSLYLKEGIYRTPTLMPIFHHNKLILKEKRLLEIDEKREFLTKPPQRVAQGTSIEPLTALLSFIQSIKSA